MGTHLNFLVTPTYWPSVYFHDWNMPRADPAQHASTSKITSNTTICTLVCWVTFRHEIIHFRTHKVSIKKRPRICMSVLIVRILASSLEFYCWATWQEGNSPAGDSARVNSTGGKFPTQSLRSPETYLRLHVNCFLFLSDFHPKLKCADKF